jgi:hypothetical protein
LGLTVLYGVLTLVLAWPVARHAGSRVLSPDSPDTDLFLWTLSWDTYAFTHQPFAIFDANIFHPNQHTLAYSENVIGSALFAAPVVWLTGNVVLAMNLVVLLSCVLCGVGCYVLGRRVGLSVSAAVITGLVFAFSPPRFLRLDQLFLTTIQWLPFSLAYLHSYFETGRRGDLRLALGFFSLQALTSGHGGVFLAVAALALAGYRLAFGEPLAIARRLRDVGITGVLLMLPVMLIAIPYQRVQAEMGLTRSLADWRILRPESFLASPTYAQTLLLSRFLPDAHVNDTASAYAFPGWAPLILAVLALVAARKSSTRTSPRWWSMAVIAADLVALGGVVVGIVAAVNGPIRLKAGGLVLLSTRHGWRAWFVALMGAAARGALLTRVPLARLPDVGQLPARVAGWGRACRRNPTVFFVLLFALGLLLAIGPPLSLWPLVYWMPGFNFIRAPARFLLLSVLSLSVLAGLGFDAATAGFAPRRRRMAVMIVGTLLVAECLVPFDAARYRVDIPAVDRWLAGRPKPFAVAELPVPQLSTVGLFQKRQSEYMMHSTVHWQKTVHGWSGLQPPAHADLYDALTRFPDEDSLGRLKQFNVDYLVVHVELYSPGEWTNVEHRLGEFEPRLKLEYADASGRVYSLRR